MTINQKILSVLDWYEIENCINEHDTDGMTPAIQKFDAMADNEEKYNSTARFMFSIWRDRLNEIANKLDHGESIENLIKIFDILHK